MRLIGPRIAAVLALSAAPYAVQAADAVFTPLDVAIANSAHDWAGAYVGINGGYAWGEFSNTTPLVGAEDIDGDGALGGFQIGYNKQLGSVVIGVEGDVQAASIEETGVAGTTTSLDWFSTARGRIGYAFDSTLVYGTAGLAVAGVETELSGLDGGTDDQVLVGFAAGAGVEQSVTENLSLKAEYLYVDTDEETFQTGATESTSQWDGHVVRFGANLKF